MYNGTLKKNYHLAKRFRRIADCLNDLKNCLLISTLQSAGLSLRFFRCRVDTVSIEWIMLREARENS